MAEIGIIQYDRNGNPMEFYGKKVLRVDTTDGGTRDFVHANLVEKTVELDFSGGDMAVVPGEDEVFSKVSIPVPESLTPGNIAEGVDIAGIIGTFAGAGAAVTFGTITPTAAGIITITHDLGVVPDFFLLWNGTNGTAMIQQLFVAFALSDAYKAKINSSKGARGIGYTYSSNKYTSLSYGSVNDAGCFLSSPTNQTIVAGNNYWPVPALTCCWVAIGGLT